MITKGEEEKDTMQNEIDQDELILPENYFKKEEQEEEKEDTAGEKEEDPGNSKPVDFDSELTKAVKEEQKREEKKKKKSEGEKKHKFALIARLMAIISVPMAILVIFFFIFFSVQSEKNVKPFIRKEMNALTASVTEAFAVSGRGDFSVEDGKLLKGEAGTELVVDFIDECSKRSEAVLRVYYGANCVMSSKLPGSEERASMEALPDKIYEKVKAGNYYFDFKEKLDGTKGFLYVYPLMQESSGKVIGAVACEQSRKDMTQGATTAKKALLGISLLLVAVGVTASFFEVKNIIECLNQSKETIGLVSEGMLRSTVKDRTLKRQDEIGDIGVSVTSMVQSLTKLIGEISSSEKEVSEAAEQLHSFMEKISQTTESVNKAIEEIAKGATSQASETMQANTQVALIGDAIGAAVTEVSSLDQSARKMSEISINADKTLQELLIISKESDDAVLTIKKQTIETNESAMQIQKATDMITEISSQTNLLSLNASIEAARVGEAGMGFAVVADEIRQLAEQSKTSANEIQEIVENLIGKSNVSVKTMNGVTAKISVQNDKLDETLQVFQELSSEISTVMKAIKEISMQTETLTKLRSGVVSIVEGLAAIAEENAAGAEETSASMFEVNTIVEECMQQTEKLISVQEKLEENASKFSV